MHWNNYGRKGWEIDHIKPLSKVDWVDPASIAAAIHYTNLQPLWGIENRSKGNKFPPKNQQTTRETT